MPKTHQELCPICDAPQEPATVHVRWEATHDRTIRLHVEGRLVKVWTLDEITQVLYDAYRSTKRT